jgi:hypothetical protein
MPIILASQEVGSWFEASPGKKLARFPSHSTKKLGIVAHNYNPSCMGGVHRRIMVSGYSQAEPARPYLKNNLKQKRTLVHG